jgi:hypothetical protein
MTISEPLSIPEQVKSFWDVWGAMLSLVGGGFAAGFSALVVDRLKNRKQTIDTIY